MTLSWTYCSSSTSSHSCKSPQKSTPVLARHAEHQAPSFSVCWSCVTTLEAEHSESRGQNSASSEPYPLAGHYQASHACGTFPAHACRGNGMGKGAWRFNIWISLYTSAKLSLKSIFSHTLILGVVYEFGGWTQFNALYVLKRS